MIHAALIVLGIIVIGLALRIAYGMGMVAGQIRRDPQ